VLHDYALYKSTFTLLYFTILYWWQRDMEVWKYAQCEKTHSLLCLLACSSSSRLTMTFVLLGVLSGT